MAEGVGCMVGRCGFRNGGNGVVSSFKEGITCHVSTRGGSSGYVTREGSRKVVVSSLLQITNVS